MAGSIAGEPQVRPRARTLQGAQATFSPFRESSKEEGSRNDENAIAHAEDAAGHDNAAMEGSCHGSDRPADSGGCVTLDLNGESTQSADGGRVIDDKVDLPAVR